ncbi:MAG: MerR family transcriptional regulator [Chloroflexi bacterium]|nr:MAG: MerR family transcriptional regulator [Chloroflexota bacterium]
MNYTVKQLAKLARVSNRTLHYYDEIGLLRPESYSENGYRYYGEEAMLRLQQILFFRELDFSLEQIKTILDSPDFDLLGALQAHRKALLEQADRLNSLVETVDNTIKHIKGEIQMSEQDFYKGFDEEKQKRYAEEAQKRWGETAATSQKRWNAYTRDEKNKILGAMHELSKGIADNMDKGPESAEVQYWIDRWYKHINQYFYDCSLEIFENLGKMYVEDPQFQATYEKIRPGMAALMEKAMLHYCKVNAGK